MRSPRKQPTAFRILGALAGSGAVCCWLGAQMAGGTISISANQLEWTAIFLATLAIVCFLARFFSSNHDEGAKRRISNQDSLHDPIGPSFFRYTQPPLPRSVAIASAILVSLLIAWALVAPAPRGLKPELIPHERNERIDLFANRFGDWGGVGGPDIDLVPLPRPRPLRENVPLPRPRPLQRNQQ